MSKTPQEVNVYFRFLKLNKMQAYTLKKELMGADFHSGSSDGEYLGTVELSEMSLHDINDFFVRQRLPIVDCDILLSTTSSQLGSFLNVPNVVNNMLKYIDCPLTIELNTETQC